MAATWFSSSELAGLRDFWRIYDANYHQIQARTLALALDDPMFGPIVRAMPADQLARQQAESRDLMRRAIDGAWGDYERSLRTEGAAYAWMGVEYGAWHRAEAVRACRGSTSSSRRA